MFKNFIIIILCVIVVYLFYVLLSGSFCHCSTVICPSHVYNPLKGYFV